MRVPYGWVREFVDGLPEVGAVAERLTMSGLEVESVSTPDPRLVDGLVTARIVEMGRHPNADRLTLCRVDDGSEIVSIVCGATNHKAGDGVVLARPGTVLPDGRKISRSKIRGEESRGMLCSAAEIGLGDEQSGIIILDPSSSSARHRRRHPRDRRDAEPGRLPERARHRARDRRGLRSVPHGGVSSRDVFASGRGARADSH